MRSLTSIANNVNPVHKSFATACYIGKLQNRVEFVYEDFS